MLDCITIVSESTPKNFVSECRRSIKVAAEMCPYPVNIIETPGVPGHIGNAMLGGLAKSTAGYVCFVDDDDFVLPSAFACLHRHFAAKPMAICAREIRLLHNGALLPAPSNHRHALTAWRRDVFDSVPLSENPAFPMVPLLRHVAADAVDELSWVYVYRIRRSGGMALRAKHGLRI